MPHRQQPILSGLAGLQAGPEASAAHHPHTLIISCIDSRVLPHRLLGLQENEAVISQRIAAVISPVEEADPVLLSVLAFQGLKEIRNIILMVHTDCGGATLAAEAPHDCVSHPNPKAEAIRRWVRRAGDEVPNLLTTFSRAAAYQPPETTPGGDCGCSRLPTLREAMVDTLARNLGVLSLRNLMRYPGMEGTVEGDIMAGRVKVSLVCYDVRAGAFEIYNAEEGRYFPYEETRYYDHFCGRADDCAACSCTDRMTHNLARAPGLGPF